MVQAVIRDGAFRRPVELERRLERRPRRLARVPRRDVLALGVGVARRRITAHAVARLKRLAVTTRSGVEVVPQRLFRLAGGAAPARARVPMPLTRRTRAARALRLIIDGVARQILRPRLAKLLLGGLAGVREEPRDASGPVFARHRRRDDAKQSVVRDGICVREAHERSDEDARAERLVRRETVFARVRRDVHVPVERGRDGGVRGIRTEVQLAAGPVAPRALSARQVTALAVVHARPIVCRVAVGAPRAAEVPSPVSHEGEHFARVPGTHHAGPVVDVHRREAVR